MSMELFQSGLEQLHTHIRKRSKPIKVVIAGMVNPIHRHYLELISNPNLDYKLFVRTAAKSGCTAGYLVRAGTKLVYLTCVFPGTKHTLLLTSEKCELRHDNNVVFTTQEVLRQVDGDYATNKKYILALDSIEPSAIGRLPLGGIIFTKVQTKYLLAMYKHILTSPKPLLRQDFVNLGVPNPHSYDETLNILNVLQLAKLSFKQRGEKLRAEHTVPTENIYQIGELLSNLPLSFISDSRTTLMCEILTDMASRTEDNVYLASDIPVKVFNDYVARTQAGEPLFMCVGQNDQKQLTAHITQVGKQYIESWTKINNLISTNFK